MLKTFYPRLLNFDHLNLMTKTAFLKGLYEVPWNIVESVDDVNDAVFIWERLFQNKY